MRIWALVGQHDRSFSTVMLKRADLKFWLEVAATALLMVATPSWRAGRPRLAWKGLVGKERPFGEPQSSEETYAGRSCWRNDLVVDFDYRYAPRRRA
jgi:hypothetical protein